MSILHTSRLTIRPFEHEDLAAIHGVLDRAFDGGLKVDDAAALAERRGWLEWARLCQEWFDRLHQPPYGDRAVVLAETGAVVGAVGLVPLLDVFDQIPELRRGPEAVRGATAEVGLFWAIDPEHHGQGYATEAGRALIDDAFARLRLNRILATTTYDNLASQAVMKKLGLRLTRNPLPEPAWLQVVGVLDNMA